MVKCMFNFIFLNQACAINIQIQNQPIVTTKSHKHFDILTKYLLKKNSKI